MKFKIHDLQLEFEMESEEMALALMYSSCDISAISVTFANPGYNQSFDLSCPGS